MDVDALHTIYGHGSNALKSEFYDAMVAFRGNPSLFTTRSREDHTRKRKFVSHALTMKSVLEYEPTISKYSQTLIEHWDEMCKGASKEQGDKIGAQVWTAKASRAYFDCMPCKLFSPAWKTRSNRSFVFRRDQLPII